MRPLEVLRISTVVDQLTFLPPKLSFGSAKNFYCCRFGVDEDLPFSFGSAKNFYCCRFVSLLAAKMPLEVLRISTVVDRHYYLSLL